MGIARKAEDIDTHGYWADVKDALTDVCKLSADDAMAAVSKSRRDLTGLSDWGRLLAYHDSVPQATEDLWKQGPGAEASNEETEAVRSALIRWYAKRNRERGLPHSPDGGGTTAQ